MTEHFDALVIGGGPGGATTALLLARAGWSVVLLERKLFPRRKVCGEFLSATNLPLLSSLGVAEDYRESAGPSIRQVGLFAGQAILSADLPRPSGGGSIWENYGHALGREHLDTLLLKRAEREGVSVRQPWSVLSVMEEGPRRRCLAQSLESGRTADFTAKVAIAAHGSWDRGPLPTQPAHCIAQPSDLLGFKAHFVNVDSPPGLMPLLAFPGGYGGMVHTDNGRVSFSCCVRRDCLAGLRAEAPGQSAGQVVLDHIVSHCLGARRMLAGASRQGEWLSSGPIRPGIRLPGPRGLFLVGNCAGEAHPVIAEGISMAMQSAWLAARSLVRWRIESGRAAALPEVSRAYARDWRRAFSGRLWAAAAVAHWAMRPAAVAGSLPWLRFLPGLLTWGARLSGKTARVVQRPSL